MITARFESAAVEHRLKRIAERGGNLARPLNAIGEVLLTSIAKNFEDGGRYSTPGSVRGGTNRWHPLAASTLLNRNRSYGIMNVSGTLARSFQKTISGNTLAIGTNRIQAAILHGGGKTKPHVIRPRNGKALAFNSIGGHIIARSVNHPGSDIPARPILVVQDEDVDESLHILDRYLYA